MAFSINFSKNFFAVKSEDRIRNALESRIVSILNKVGLGDRYISDYSEIRVANEIEYDEVKKRLNILKDESLDYLRKVLQ